ncbi:MAG TPA: glutaminyl-peptide cyclotransferase [Polyangiaceae bacterium]|nr:glutaminyl-peptide cyclotransferase [Polyangiaceae bacterium]
MAKALPHDVRRSARRMTPGQVHAVALVVGLGLALSAAGALAQTATPRVEAVYPHDTAAFTEGLELFEGKLYESTGLNGKSTVRRVTLMTGAIEKSINLDASFFGEGLTRIDRTLINLTYTTGVAIVFDVDTFAELKRFTYTGQGWGLCYDGSDLIMSNGTDKLAFRDPTTFALRREVTVQRSGASIDMLNELECVGSLVYVNEWKTDNILRVDKATGNVLTLIDASALLTADEKRNADVLNGIAYDEAKRRFYLTGKYWPKLFEVSFDFDPGAGGDGGVDAGSADAGGRGDAAPPRDAPSDATTLDGATPRDASSARDAADASARDSGSTDAISVDVGGPITDGSIPSGVGLDGGGTGGAGGAAGTEGGAGSMDPEGSPTPKSCACRTGGAPASVDWRPLTWWLAAALLGRGRRAARRSRGRLTGGHSPR